MTTLLIMGGLAACDPGTSNPEPQATTTPPAAVQAPGTEAQQGEARITMSECMTPSQGRVHFQLGNNVLQIPATAIRDAVPANLDGPLEQDAVQQALRDRVADGQGCPERPLDTVLLLIQDDLGHPLLNGTVGLLRSPGGDITAPFAQLTRQLQQSPTENCRQLNGELLACVGTETRGERVTDVMYLISTDTTLVMNSGGPLAARCVLNETGVIGCNMVDRLTNSITFDAELSPGDYTSTGLSAARDAALARLRSYQL